MGKNNKSRRAAKAKKRRREARRSASDANTDRANSDRSPPNPGGSYDPLSDSDLIMAGVLAEHRNDVDTLTDLVAVLLERPRRRIAMELQGQLERRVSGLWDNGWQPGDAIQYTTRKLGRVEIDILRGAIAADAAGYQQWGETVAPGWMAQLDDHGALRRGDGSDAWCFEVDGSGREVLVGAIRVLCFLNNLPRLPQLVHPPSKWSSLAAAHVPAGTSLAPGVLAKIRALLAKAESTSFDAEAEAFTAKAQELMTRHRIDRLTTGDGEPVDEVAVGRRIWIDNPYPEAKTALLAGIADANGCRSVWTKNIGFVTLFGFADDLEGVEEIFTSLLVQATAALQREGSRVDRYGRSRTTRFRRSFLVAFAERISERLHGASDETVRAAEEETGHALVAVLASRHRAADEAVERAFGDLQPVSLSVTDPEGYLLGTWFGDRADLGVREDPRHIDSLPGVARTAR